MVALRSKRSIEKYISEHHKEVSKDQYVIWQIRSGYTTIHLFIAAWNKLHDIVLGSSYPVHSNQIDLVLNDIFGHLDKSSESSSSSEDQHEDFSELWQ